MRQASPYTPPNETNDDADSLLVGGIGLRIIAIVHARGGALLGGLLVRGWNSGKYEVEVLPWVLLAILLLVLARGLWRKRNWSRGLALIIHWPVFVGAASLLPMCLAYVLAVTPKGIAVVYAFAVYGLFFCYFRSFSSRVGRSGTCIGAEPLLGVLTIRIRDIADA